MALFKSVTMINFEICIFLSVKLYIVLYLHRIVLFLHLNIPWVFESKGKVGTHLR